jgi:metal-sulfur cluster biosynthetic enzyme
MSATQANCYASYVVVNDATGDVVQVSDVNDPDWKPVWDEPWFQR